MDPDANNQKFPFEEYCAKTFKEIHDSSDLTAWETQFGEVPRYLDDPEYVFGSLAQDYGLPFSPAVQRNFFRFDKISAYWESTEEGSELVGEFQLNHVYSRRLMSHTWEGTDDWERNLYKELRIFDNTPRTGSGRMAGLRASPGTTDPEIWFFDMRQGAMEMELDYGTYLDTLMVTKGAIGWQYLFCDAGFGDSGFTPIVGGLKEMLDVFPRLFPDHDYSDLKARFRERA
ncbi:hypothetical protein QIS99_02215 [Streptomyces sp. B-S-A8]|uniref:SMI1/KNR4 family protein n=1 Tax=Streptomyces solicavernae TaxID=3043614 RepID=A0ABT6RL66_9ACTN|nr:hypothetical protein [Streptomyces sp. B-S-A8]MDI3385035.1 hypothetical protein [Streptomyces sp. B-S-A8]